MSPLDHELRAALTSRAVTLTPAVDPLAGIEARAGQLRRRRLAGSIAGTALAVALVAVGVPAAIGSSNLVPPSPQLAATSTAPAPSPSVSTAPRDPFVLAPDAAVGAARRRRPRRRGRARRVVRDRARRRLDGHRALGAGVRAERPARDRLAGRAR